MALASCKLALKQWHCQATAALPGNTEHCLAWRMRAVAAPVAARRGRRVAVWATGSSAGIQMDSTGAHVEVASPTPAATITFAASSCWAAVGWAVAGAKKSSRRHCFAARPSLTPLT